MKAYYDPDLQKENNDFCQRGFKAGNLKWIINEVVFDKIAFFDDGLGYYMIEE